MGWLALLCIIAALPARAGGAYPTDNDLPASAMTAQASEQLGGRPASSVLDGRPETCWETTNAAPNPTLTLNLNSKDFATPSAAAVSIAAIRVLPRAQNVHAIPCYNLYVSADSSNGRDGTWKLVAAGKWLYEETLPAAENEKRAWFQPVAAKYLKLEFPGRGYFSIGEVRVERSSANPARFSEIPRPTARVELTVPPPRDAETQARHFQERNSPAQVKSLAADFFSWINLEHPGLRNVKIRYAAGDYLGALAAYRAFFLGQMRHTVDFWPLLTAFEYPNSRCNAASANELMFNVATYSNKKVALGGPGRVDWSFDPQMLYLDQFYPLLHAYLENGDPRYLDQWAAYADDLTLHRVDGRSAVDLGGNCECQGVRGVPYLFRYFSWLACSLPDDGNGLPETTLARVLLKRVREYPPVSALYARSDPQNWQMDVSEYLVAAGILLDRVHFKVGPFYLQEGIRALAAYDTHCNYLDGTELQRDVWYNEMWIANGALPVYRQLKAYRPELLTPEWGGWFQDSFRARADYRVRITSPTGQLPLVLRNEGYLRIPTNILDEVPEARQDASLPVILDLLTTNSQKKEPAKLPSFTSDAFPYAGFYLIRQGWKLTDQQGTFFNAGRISDGFRVRANNKFALHALGEDLIIGGEQGAYCQIPSPLTVDGREQQCDFGILGFGHRRMYPPVSDSPNPFRWHCSGRYDLVEGVYNGPYANGPWGTLDVEGASKTMIRDVTHRRSVQFLRRHGLWIITDRVASSAAHAYTQTWEFPVPAEQVRCIPEQRLMQTQVGQAAVTLCQFTQDALTYAVKDAPAHYTYNHKPLPAYSHADISFAGAGAHAVITAIYPHPGAQSPLLDVRKLTQGKNTVGFSAKAPDGAQARYLASLDGVGTLVLDSMTVTGESLLLVTEPDGAQTGMVLGCRALSVHGIAQHLDTPDAEFSIAGKRLAEVQPIYRPMEPVVITPGTNVFTDHLAVSLTCATPGAVIHYSLDGSDPTPDSARYAEPFTLTVGATVKARAFRAGNTRVPDTMSGTLASSITRAVFTKEALRPASNATAARAGLRYQYYQGPWKILFAALETVRPIKSGDVPNLFDIKPRQTEDYFAFRYTGYLQVPADGIYTLHFPDEFCRLDIVAGYDIRMTLDGRPCLPEARRHAHGTCSIALAKGLHPLFVDYMDYRGENATIKEGEKLYPLRFDRTGTLTGKARMNFPNLSPERNLIWDGVTARLDISGPGMKRQPLPAAWLWH